MRRLMTVAVLAGILALPALADEDEFELLEQKVLKLAADKATITAQQAILAATKEAGAAKLVEVELYLKGDTPVFGLEFLSGAGELEIVVDASSGKVLKKEREEEDEDADADEAEEREQALKALSAAKLTLTQAIETALREVKGGKVVEAETEFEHGKLEYDVKLATGGVFKEVELDADGKVKEVEVKKAEGHAWIFDHDAAGQPPAGWKFGYTHPEDGKATWVVRKDANAFSGPNVLDLKTASADHVFNVAMATGTSYKDVNVRTRIRPNSGEEDQGGGVIWRCKDASNYYICRMNPLESNFRVYKVVDGRRRKLKSARLEMPAGKWYVVRAKMVGDHITCYVNGKKLLDVHDDTFTDAGMVGLWTKADAASSFDNVAAQAARASKNEDDDEMEAEHDDKKGEYEENEGEHEQTEEGDGDEDEHASGGESNDNEWGFVDSFALDPSDLAPNGRNTYFILEPGYQLTLEGREGRRHTRLVITVLNETKRIGEFETRIVEERETQDGALVEVSRNYFAISKRSGNAFYFGESVDVYESGKVVAHQGGWEAGVNGARAGLIMPGAITVGDRYCQEIAPKVAMDRAENVSTSETITTGAGTFTGCLKVRETSPLEPGQQEYKLYAPGVGIVRDGALELVKIAR